MLRILFEEKKPSQSVGLFLCEFAKFRFLYVKLIEECSGLFISYTTYLVGQSAATTEDDGSGRSKGAEPEGERGRSLEGEDLRGKGGRKGSHFIVSYRLGDTPPDTLDTLTLDRSVF